MDRADCTIPIGDEELVRRVVAAPRPVTRKGTGCPRWSIVGDRFCLGSTFSARLCRRFGFDPDEMVRSGK